MNLVLTTPVDTSTMPSTLVVRELMSPGSDIDTLSDVTGGKRVVLTNLTDDSAAIIAKDGRFTDIECRISVADLISQYEARQEIARNSRRTKAVLAAYNDDSPNGMATRASDSLGYTLRNDVAEYCNAVLRIIASEAGVAFPDASAIAAKITELRGPSPAPTLPSAADVADRGGRRVTEVELFGLLGAFVDAGAGDPIQA